MLAPGISARKRIWALLAIVSLVGAGLSVRLAYWQIQRAEELSFLAAEVRAKEIRIGAPRGDIYDRHGWPLAANKTAESVFAVPKEITEAERPAVAAALGQVLGMTQDKVMQLISRKASYVYIKRKVTEQQAQVVRSLLQQGQLPGIGLEPETERYYPEGTLAAHALGFAGIDSQGLAGLELEYDKWLTGRAGAIEIEYDALGHEIAGGQRRITPPRPGISMYTTLDAGIQQMVERDLERVVEEHKAQKAAIIVMKVKTGEVLAFAQYPTYDPNQYAAYDQSLWRNWVVADAYYPGSVFKPVTASAALEEGLLRPNSPFTDSGCTRVPGWNKPICNWNHKGFGSGTFRDVVITSSNVGFAQVGMMLGVERFYKYLDRFNLTAETGIDIAGEGVGITPKRKTAKQVDLAVMGFGQTLTATPIGMLAAVNAVANDGTWVQPHLMKELRTQAGELVTTHQTLTRQVVSVETAREMQEMMVGVVSDPKGTGKAAAVPGYRVAGKTGTSEKFQGTGKQAYIASFVGFAPVPNPEVSVLITVHEPQGIIYGGQIAAPIFSGLVANVLRYLELPPELPTDKAANAVAGATGVNFQKVKVPAFLNLPVADARAIAERSGLSLHVDGPGPLITHQDPAPDTEVAPGTAVTAAAEPARVQVLSEDYVEVPLLTGMTLRQASATLEGSGLRLRFAGSGAVARQEPAPGVAVPRGTRIQIWLQPAGP